MVDREGYDLGLLELEPINRHLKQETNINLRIKSECLLISLSEMLSAISVIQLGLNFK